MRLFIAIPLPEPVKKQLADLQQPMEGMRWQQEEQMHLTLKFLGSTDRTKARKLQEKLKQVGCLAFDMTLAGFGYFPEGGEPKVLWVGIDENEALNNLQHTVEHICISTGFDAEDRPFKPHITIARVRGTSKRDVHSFINQHKRFRIPEIPVEEFVLYESKLDPEGATHHRLDTFRLKDDE